MARYWEGKLIRLRGVEPTDVDGHYEVDQEDDISRFPWVMNPPISRARTEAWILGASKEGAKGHEFTAQMEILEGGTLVGSIATHHCDQRAGVFSYGLRVEDQHRGNGCASDAICLILRYFFLELRYQKCNVEVMEINPGSQRLHEKLGFQTEGRCRRVVYTHGKHSDMIEYGMTLEEFRDRYPDYWRGK